jgi:hypothetical protein
METLDFQAFCNFCGDDIIAKYPLKCISCSKISCMTCVNNDCVCDDCVELSNREPTCMSCEIKNIQLNNDGFCMECIEKNAFQLSLAKQKQANEKIEMSNAAPNVNRITKTVFCKMCGKCHFQLSEWTRVKETNVCDGCKIMKFYNSINNSNHK